MAQQSIYVPEPGFRTKLDDFRDAVNRKHQLQLNTYNELHDYSVNHLNEFWLDVWDFCGIKSSKKPTKISFVFELSILPH